MLRHSLKLVAAAALSAALGLPATAGADGEVNLYSARQENLIKPLLDDFTRDTGIRVNLLTGRADELLQRLRLEGRNSPADVLITVDAGNLHQAQQAGVLAPIESEVLNANVPESYRDVDGRWYGLSLRARPIMYHKDKVDPAELSTYEALTDPKWRGRICVRSSANVYNQSLVAAMIATEGAEAASEWVNGLVANFARPPQGGDRDQIRAVAAGVCDIALANTYYIGAMLAGDDATQRAAAEQVGVFFPNQDDRGTHVNISGAGVTTHAPNRENGIRLIEYLTSESAQRWYAEANQEYPVRPDVPASEVLRSFGEFEADSLNLSLLGAHNAEAVRIMDRARWR
ncbi:Fe(3+) ABC transporter substrate-binding protein [Thioalkalivibrio paradoxus]|uniref:Iron deficiency-induced protein A n=1 Tax=Thioalkalivibrio paradoxus ARh 1 TaxID=713585 RepID=W0DQX8_9GAMM|nr:Fe(3+) ABC transporter substrate-binding protein [Thioalkalivibrio paradoxus]AHE99398.1 iron deficiency-induced protein A [Thioalkalivibrio paradoxus ARh 1]